MAQVEMRVYSTDPNDGRVKLESATVYDAFDHVLNELAAVIHGGTVIDAIVLRSKIENRKADTVVADELDTLFSEE